MAADLVVKLTGWTVNGFLLLLAGMLFSQIVTGQINTRHLLHGRRKDGTRYISPERLQLLLLTLWTAFRFLSDAAQHAHSGTLPDVPPKTLIALGLSHGVYLGGKTYFSLLMPSTVSPRGE